MDRLYPPGADDANWCSKRGEPVTHKLLARCGWSEAVTRRVQRVVSYRKTGEMEKNMWSLVHLARVGEDKISGIGLVFRCHDRCSDKEASNPGDISGRAGHLAAESRGCVTTRDLSSG